MRRTHIPTVLLSSLLLSAAACSDDGTTNPAADVDSGDAASDTASDAADPDAGDAPPPDATTDVADTTGDAADTAGDAADTADDASDAPDVERRVYPRDGVLRLNHVQVKGTHNSYHVEPPNPLDASHRYTHAPLDVQLAEQGVRQFEIDVHYDGDGFFRVYHLRVIDEVSTCDRFTDCLGVIRAWSDANPDHAPVFIWIEPKDELDVVSISGHYDELDAEIRSVFPDRLITPDGVRGDHETLREAVLTDGWPTLGEVRGHVVFIMLDTERHQRAYTFDRTSLDGRAMFVDVDSLDEPFAAFVKYNDPIGSGEAISAAAAQGFIVACNAGGADNTDEEVEAKVTAALASGAHTSGTDWPAPVDDRYWFEMPGGAVARCNPISAPAECEASDIE